jgi:5'-3' exonuclease
MRYLHTALITLLLVSTSEGGIRQLTKYLTTGTFLKSWKEADKQHPQYFDHVCIDMNEILHGIHNLNVPSHFTFAKMLFHRLDYLLDIVVPKSSLVMAFDGPAPFAKIQTQQLRRMMESDISRYTPGTIFMNKMEDMATSYVLKKLQQPLYRNISVFISGPDCPGEGELKLLNWVHNIMPSVSDSVAMCGRDGDVVVQAMTLHNITNRYVVQGHRPGEKMRTTYSILLWFCI